MKAVPSEQAKLRTGFCSLLALAGAQQGRIA